MKIMFIHQNMPGQYKHLARIFAEDKNNQVVFVTKREKTSEIPNVTKVRYNISREPQFDTHRYLINFERGIFYGQEVWRVCKKLQTEHGFKPDVICAHPGWGEALFIKELYPDVPLLNFQEFFYNTHGADVNFDPDFFSNDDELARVRVKNSINLFGITHCDWAISPTFWQQKQYPKEFHHKISVLHDGIDTDLIKPMDWKEVKLREGLNLRKGDEIVTYITRNFEQYRGFPTFAKAMEIVQKKRPKTQFIMVGADGAGYGKVEKGKVFRHEIMNKIKTDPKRTHFLGYLPYNDMLKVLQISSTHVYLTVPFVLSWSMMEAMASGCLLIGSNTHPVKEVIEDNKNGLLVDFFSPEDLAQKIEYALDNQKDLQHVRNAARQTIIDRYSLNKVLPMHIDLIKDVAQKRLPPPTAQKIELFHQRFIREKAA